MAKSAGFSGAHGASDHKGSGNAGKVDFIKGGPSRSHGKHSSGPQQAGQTAQAGKSSGKFAEGGHSNHMFPRMGATPAQAGCTGKSLTPPGSNSSFAQGGSGHMFGRRGSQTRSPGDTGGM